MSYITTVICRLLWQGFPFFVSGTSTPTGKFFATHCMLSSHEDTKAWSESYMFLKNMNIIPKFRMGDGAQEITNAGTKVFGDDGVRLMCWPHVYRNLVPRLSQIRKLNKVLADNVLDDIEFLQWSAVTESFDELFDLLESKYTEDQSQSKEEHDELCSFFRYFRAQWGPRTHAHRLDDFLYFSSRCCKICIHNRWYEGAYAWGIGNNQGIEGTNKSIKASHTFKRRAPIGHFMEIVKRMVKEWGEKDDSLLHGSRMDYLESDPSGLRLKTEG